MTHQDEDDDGHRPIKILGRDIAQIPCFREAFINGIMGGVVIGLGTFMGTSNPRVACNYAMGSYTLLTLVSYTYCRYKWTKDKRLAGKLQEGMRRQALYQGTDIDRQIREDYEKNEK